MSKTIILECSCENSYQDQKYGKNKRVFNEGMKQYQCTVCSKMSGSVDLNKKKEK